MLRQALEDEREEDHDPAGLHKKMKEDGMDVTIPPAFDFDRGETSGGESVPEGDGRGVGGNRGGEELAEVLTLAEQFPTRQTRALQPKTQPLPVFPRAS